MKELLGFEVGSVYTNEDKTYLFFTNIYDSAYNSFLYKAYTDCCSSAWFESINNIENILNETIIGIEIKKNTYIEEKNDTASVEIYGYTLKTMKGYTDIEFRSQASGPGSLNYGGSCDLVSIESFRKEPPFIKVELSDNRIVELRTWKNK